MKKLFNGFSLIELMVAISLLAILSTIGYSTYANSQKGAKDIKRKADIDSIAKAYDEIAFDALTVTYRALSDSDFTRGGVPNPPEGGEYLGLIASTTTPAPNSFRVCAVLEGGNATDCNEPATDKCYCRQSLLGKAVFPTLRPTNPPGPSLTPRPTVTSTPIPTATPTITPTPSPTPTPRTCNTGLIGADGCFEFTSPSRICYWNTYCPNFNNNAFICYGNSGACTVVTNEKKNGNQSLRVTGQGFTWGSSLNIRAIGTLPDQKLCLSGWIKKGSAGNGPYIGLQEVNPPHNGDFVSPAISNTDWQYVYKTVTAAAFWYRITSVQILSPLTQTNYFDDVVLTYGACP